MGDPMASNFRIVSFSAPSELVKEMQEVAKREHRTISDLLRECFRQYSALQNLKELRKKGRKAAKSRKLTRKDVGYEVE
jgi:predicted transcriptional regulator